MLFLTRSPAVRAHMFTLAEIEDRIEISSACTNKEKELFTKINAKYANKMVTGLGLGVCVESLQKIHYYKIEGEFLSAKVDFIIVVFRFYDDELLCAKVVDQHSGGVEVELKFYGRITIAQQNMPKDFDVAVVEQHSRKVFCWFWRYKDHKLWFRNGETIRFKVRMHGNAVEGRVDEAGLGPLSWWE